MINKQKQKLFQSLRLKKNRQAHKLFFCESIKIVKEFFNSNLKNHEIYSTIPIEDIPTEIISEKEMKKISVLKTPSNIIGLFEIPTYNKINENGPLLALDNLSDPGNLGTIIRLCDWFGITDILCNKDTVDCFNPKVVQASMGSLSRVNCHYIDLTDYLKNSTKKTYATTLEGKSIYKTKLEKDAIILMGNESHGISSAIEKLCSENISIPKTNTHSNIDSLNVSIATGIILNEFLK